MYTHCFVLIRNIFIDRNCKSLNRQLNKFGFTKPRQGKFAKMYYNPSFYRGMNSALMDKILKVDAVAVDVVAGISSTSKTTNDTTKEGGGDEDNNEDDDGVEDWASRPSLKFPQMLYAILEEEKHPEVLRWSANGQAFFVNQDSPEISKVLFKYFKRESSRVSHFHHHLV